ncbi:MAG: hypothetical protein WD334_02620, partial [Chitinophagales bacterium]
MQITLIDQEVLKKKYYKNCPSGYFLESDNLWDMEKYLDKQNFLKPNEQLKSVSVAGNGNMNLVLRVKSNLRSFIVKQSRPWVEKYPHIEAPDERSIIEGQFYGLIKLKNGIEKFFPDLLKLDAASGVLLIEDLGEAADYMDIYSREISMNTSDIQKLVLILSELHSSYNVNTTNERIYNRSMRKLNARHIFDFPFSTDNDFDLDKIQLGLAEITEAYKKNDLLLEKVKKLKQVYLSDGHFLLMGDYYPGSWLNTNNGIRVIDPEFCFFGPVEFDLGVLIAHLIMSGHEDTVEMALSQYYGTDQVDRALLNAFASVEIFRRIMGIAQLPLPYTVEEKSKLLAFAFEML